MIEIREPSRSLGTTGLAVALVVGCGVAVAAAWAYQFLVDVIPFIYVKAFVTAGFAAGIGFVVGRVAKATKGRGMLAVGVVALVAGLAAEAASFKWAYDRQTSTDLPEVNRSLASEGLPTITLEVFRERFPMSKYLDARVEGGFFVGRSQGGTPTFSGFFVWLIWAIEAGIFAVLAWLVAMTQVDETFCDACDAWTVPEVAKTAHGVEKRGLLAAIAGGDMAALLSPEQVERSRESAVYTVHECPGCGDATLSVALTWPETDAKNKTETKRVGLIDGVVLAKADRERLKEGLRSRKASGPHAPPA